MKFYCLAILFIVFDAEVVAQTTALADSLYRTGEFDKAINAYSQAGSPEAFLQIARAYNAIGRYDKAKVQYREVLRRDPGRSVARFEFAKLCYRQKNYSSAAGLIDTLLAEFPGNAEYLYYRGLVADALGELPQGGSRPEAFRYFRESIQRDPAHLRARFQLGRLYLTVNEPDSCLMAVDPGLAYYPDDTALLNLKGLALFNEGYHREAIPVFKRLLQLGELKPHLFDKLGNAYLTIGEPDSARIAYRDLLQFREEEARAFLGLARSFHMSQEPDSAAVYTRKAIAAKKPELAAEYELLARLTRQLGDMRGALAYYRKLREERPDDPRVDFEICALIDQTTPDLEAKIEAYEQYLEKWSGYRNYFTQTSRRRLDLLRKEARTKSPN